MKRRVAELEGALLDAAVALCEDDRLPDYWRDPEDGTCWSRPGREQWSPSTDWAQGGPIIEREGITVVRMHRMDWGGQAPKPTWCAWVLDADQGAGAYFDVTLIESDAQGPTYLIAAMRAYVVSKLGEEVELL